MNTSPVTNEQWEAVRGWLGWAVERYVELLRTVPDPRARTTGDWTVADTAAHLVVVCDLDLHTSTFGAAPLQWDDDVLGLVRNASLDDIEALNTRTLSVLTERDLGVLGQRTRAGVARVLEATAGTDPRASGRWLGGAEFTVAGMLGHLLNELLLHGLDIARASRTPWTIPPQAAALTFEVFVVGALHGETGRLLEYHEPGAPGIVRAELRGRHHDPIRLDAVDGRLRLGTAAELPDVRFSSEPVALVLLIWGRSGLLRPLLTGRLRVWGRRPWRAFRFLAAVRLP
jgi:hypothetical protein